MAGGKGDVISQVTDPRATGYQQLTSTPASALCF